MKRCSCGLCRVLPSLLENEERPSTHLAAAGFRVACAARGVSRRLSFGPAHPGGVPTPSYDERRPPSKAACGSSGYPNNSIFPKVRPSKPTASIPPWHPTPGIHPPGLCPRRLLNLCVSSSSWSGWPSPASTRKRRSSPKRPPPWPYFLVRPTGLESATVWLEGRTVSSRCLQQFMQTDRITPPDKRGFPTETNGSLEGIQPSGPSPAFRGSPASSLLPPQGSGTCRALTDSEKCL